MYKKVSAEIIMILVTAVIVTVPSSVMQFSHAQSNQGLQTVLDVHNQERAAVGVQPLTWSDQLAADAQTWAQQVATTGIFDHLDKEHTGLTCTGPCYGENIAGFNPSLGPSAPGEGVSLWVAEKSKYTPGSPVDLYVNGHYTQMVWQATTELGCATAPPGAGGLQYSVLLCRYSPPGNGGDGVPYGGPAQAMGEEDAAAPLQEEGAAAPPDADGGGNDDGGGDDGGDGGGNEN